MFGIPDNFIKSILRRRLSWRYVVTARGGVFALCYFDEKTKAEVNAVEFVDIAIAYHFEKALTDGDPPVSLENSVNDYLLEEKRIIEAKWNENKVVQPTLPRIPIRQWRGTHKQPLYKI